MSIRLIINADDYGYFPWVNQGIIALAAARKITATGILANSADLSAQLQLISQVQNLDAGAAIVFQFIGQHHLDLCIARFARHGLITGQLARPS